MKNANRFLTKLIWLIAALLTLRVVVRFLEQRVHDKEYWLIFAHVILFLPVIFTATFALLFIKRRVFRRLAKPRDGG